MSDLSVFSSFYYRVKFYLRLFEKLFRSGSAGVLRLVGRRTNLKCFCFFRLSMSKAHIKKGFFQWSDLRGIPPGKNCNHLALPRSCSCIQIFYISMRLREVAKKVIFLMAVPVRGGGGKRLAIRKKIHFFLFFFFCLKNSDYH